MPELVEDARAFIRDSRFRNLPPQRQVIVFREFLRNRSPDFAGFSDEGQQRTTNAILEEIEPGFLERVGATIGGAAKAVGEALPVIRPVIRAATGEITEEPPRLLSRGLAGAMAQADPRLAETFLESRTARMSADVAQDLLEMAAFFGVGGKVAAWAVPRLLGRPAAELGAEALAAASQATAKQAARQALRERILGRVTTDLTAGELYGVADIIERQRFEPLEQFVVNPIAIAGLGTALMGVGAAFRRFGQVRVREAVQLLNEDTGLQLAARDAQQVANAVARAGRISGEDAGEAVFRVARGEGSPADSLLVQGVLAKNPRLLATDFGMHLARMERPRLSTQFSVEDTPLRVVYEDAKTRQETTILPKTRGEADALIERAGREEIRLLQVSGREADVGRFRPAEAEAPRPTIPTGTEPLPTAAQVALQRPGPLVLEPTTPTALEVAQTRAGIEPSALSRAQRYIPVLPGAEPRPTQIGGVEMPPGVEPPQRLPTAAEVAATRAGAPWQPAPTGRLAEPPLTALETIQREQLRVDIPQRPIAPPEPPVRAPAEPPAEALQPPPPIQGGTTVNVADAPGITADVLQATDPRGVVAQLSTPAKEVVIVPRLARGGVAVPRELVEPPAAPAPTPPAQAAPPEAPVLKPQEVYTVPGKPHIRFFSTLDEATGTLTLTDQRTGMAVTYARDAFAEKLRQGVVTRFDPPVEQRGLVRQTLSQLPNDELVVRSSTLAEQMRDPDIRRDPVARSQVEQRYLDAVTEFQRRTGTLGEPLVRAEGRIAEAFKLLAEERGEVGFPRGRGRPPDGRTTPLPPDDIVQLNAKMLGGKASALPDGRVAVEFTVEGRTLPVTYGSRLEAFSGLQDMLRKRAEEMRLSQAVERQVRERRLDPVVEPSSILNATQDASARIQLERALFGEQPAPLDTVARYATGTGHLDERLLWQGNLALHRYGEPGRALAVEIQRMFDLADRLIAKPIGELERIRSSLSKEARSAIKRGEMFDVVEDGAPDRFNIRAAHEQLDRAAKQQYTDAQAVGVPVAKLIEDHVPHVFDIATLRSRKVSEALIKETIDLGLAGNRDEALIVLANQGLGTTRDTIIRNMVAEHAKRGVEMTRTEAEGIIDRFILRNAQRIAGNIERERLGVKGYVRDAWRAYTVLYTRNARRIAEATVFGPRDENALKLIDRITAQVGPGQGKLAREVFDAAVGRSYKPMEGWLRTLDNWQQARLSASWMPNLTQVPLNTPMAANYRALFSGIVRGVADPRSGRQLAKEAGAVANDVLADLSTRGALGFTEVEGLGLFDKVVTRTAEFMSSIFRAQELFVNRMMAPVVGETYFERLADTLRRNPNDAGALARMAEIFVAPGKIFKYDVQRAAELAAIKPRLSAIIREGNPDVLYEMKLLAAKRISDNSQFRSNVLSMPLASRDPLISMLLFRFKHFAFNQAVLLAREIMAAKQGGAHNVERTIRAVASLVAVYPPVGIALTKARSALMGSTLGSDTIDRAFEEGGTLNWLAAGIVGITTVGGAGILADMVTTAALRNKLAESGFFLSPSAATVMNILDIGTSIARGMATQDVDEFERAARSAALEFGGAGRAIIQQTLGPARGEGTGTPTLPRLPGRR